MEINDKNYVIHSYGSDKRYNVLAAAAILGVPVPENRDEQDALLERMVDLRRHQRRARRTAKAIRHRAEMLERKRIRMAERREAKKNNPIKFYKSHE